MLHKQHKSGPAAPSGHLLRGLLELLSFSCSKQGQESGQGLGREELGGGKSWEGREELEGRGLLSWELLAISKDQLSKAWGSNGVFPRALGLELQGFVWKLLEFGVCQVSLIALGTRPALRARLCLPGWFTG